MNTTSKKVNLFSDDYEPHISYHIQVKQILEDEGFQVDGQTGDTRAAGGGQWFPVGMILFFGEAALQGLVGHASVSLFTKLSKKFVDILKLGKQGYSPEINIGTRIELGEIYFSLSPKDYTHELNFYNERLLTSALESIPQAFANTKTILTKNPKLFHELRYIRLKYYFKEKNWVINEIYCDI